MPLPISPTPTSGLGFEDAVQLEDDDLDVLDDVDAPATPPHYIEAVQMRRDPHDKPRRLFQLADSRILSVTMRYSFDLVESSPLRCKALRAVPNIGGIRQTVDDACILEGSGTCNIVLGCTGDAGQVSVLRREGAKVSHHHLLARARHLTPTMPL